MYDSSRDCFGQRGSVRRMTAGTIDAGLFAALAYREWRGRRTILAFGGIIVLGVLAGRAAGGVTTDAATAQGAPGTFILQTLPGVLAIFFAIIAAFLAVERICTDHEDGWAAPLVAAGASRRRYVYSVISNVAGLAVAAYAVAVVAYVVGNMLSDGTLELRPAMGVWLKGVFFVGSSTVFGGVAAVLTRQRTLAASLIITAIAVPVALAIWLNTSWGVSEQTLQYLFIHLPPRMQGEVISVVLNHIIYSGAALLMLVPLSERYVSRYQ